ncbi:MAG: hypothetical protein Q8K32_28815 [Archangium sp.]|nr:hypothetical protein [Archangium sp.]
MGIRGWVVVLLSSCTEAPPVVVAATAPVVAPKPAELVLELPAPAPDLIAGFPDERPLPSDVDTDERLLQLMMTDPARAEAALHLLSSPAPWQTAVIAQFATRRGEKSFELEPEPPLPFDEPDAGLSTTPGPAWVREDAAPLVSPGGKKTTLPLNTQVEVKGFTGEWAEVSVAFAQTAIYSETEREPLRVVSSPVLGRVRRTHLAPTTLKPESLMLQAMKQPAALEGKLKAVGLWQQAWRIERTERTRRGLLRAAWAVQRASSMVQAALAKNLAPASGLRFAWACTTEDPPSASWLDLTKARPKTLAKSVCVSGLDARARCQTDSPAELKRAAATQAWLERIKLAPRPWLRFTVDARAPREVFLVTTPLAVADACSEFEEFTVEANSGQVHRLALPLGSQSLVVWVPLHAGVEYSVISAASESQAVSWLRSREKYRWTLGDRGELEPSLGLNASQFSIPPGVIAATFALAPERDCSCE